MIIKYLLCARRKGARDKAHEEGSDLDKWRKQNKPGAEEGNVCEKQGGFSSFNPERLRIFEVLDTEEK